MRTISRDIVGAFVFSNDNRTLLGPHSEGGTYAGYWVVLGGETKVQAVCGELLEEADLNLSPYRLIGQKGTDIREKTLEQTGERVLVKMRFRDVEVHIDKAAAQLPVRPNGEFDELRWVVLSDLPGLHLAPIVRRIFEKRGYIT